MQRGFLWMIPLVAACWVAAQSPAPPAGATKAPAAAQTPPAKAKKTHPKKAAPPPKFEKSLLANKKLTERVQALLPKDVKLESAAMGFKKQDLFLATLHAAKNLNIPFEKLKADITGTEQDSLGQAIRNYRPDLDLEQIESAAKTAEKQGKADVKETRGGAG
jgi:hypothetical protein